jgi:hypothetical protein
MFVPSFTTKTISDHEISRNNFENKTIRLSRKITLSKNNHLFQVRKHIKAFSG